MCPHRGTQSHESQLVTTLKITSELPQKYQSEFVHTPPARRPFGVAFRPVGVNTRRCMSLLPWFAFLALVLALLALDLGVFNRRPHEVSTREALGWTAVWVTISLAFNGLVYFMYERHWLGVGQTVGHPMGGKEAAVEFFAAYLIEKSLSLDNIFIIALIFEYFQVPARYQHRVLFWGVLGALVLRGTMITAGLAVIERFDWVVYLFGALLIATSVKMLRAGDEKVEPDKNPFVRLVRRVYPVVGYREHRFVVREEGRRSVTTLLLALAMVESTDLLFAVDSIPAVFAVTRDPFLVFTSNVFAILGLRSLYFALAAVMEKFRYLKVSLVFILAFVGAKMILTHHYPIPALVSLTVIVAILLVGVVASVLSPKRHRTSLPGRGSPAPEE